MQHKPKSDLFLNEETIVGARPVVHVETPRRAARLCQLEGPGAPRDFMLETDEVIVGRSRQAHIMVDSQLISRRHMSLTRSGQQFVATDLDSVNGVFLNGIKAHSAVLHDGDTLQIGDVVLVFREGY